MAADSTNLISPLKRIFGLIALEKSEIFYIYLYATVSGLIALSLPLGIQAIVNFLFGGSISTSLVVLIALVVTGVACNGMLQIAQMKVSERIQRRIFTRFSMEFSHHIPKLNMLSVDDYYLPELVNRFFDISSLQKGFSKILIDFPAATIQLFFGILLLSFYHPVFIAFGIFLLFLIYLVFRLTGARGVATSLEESNHKYDVASWLEEVARTIKTIKFMGMTFYPMKKTDKLVSGYLDAREKHFDVLVFQSWAFIVFKILITASLLIIGSILVVNQQINLGQFIAAEIVIIVLLNSIEKLILSLDTIYDTLTAIEKVQKILDKPIEREGGISINEASDLKGIEIEVSELSYGYNAGARKVLDNLSFSIKAGEKVCIFGSEGSGKTTLLRLFTGAYPSYQGSIVYNGIPIDNYDLSLLRQEIGIYLTNVELFNGTLWENLTLGDESISTAAILQVAEDIGLTTFIKHQKIGLETRIDSLGRKLPRSVIYKILLCRALLTFPKLLLIEDCWHSLERNEQERIINYLTDKHKPYTMVAVTNDPVFASKCDKILLLEEGKVAAFGTFDEVSKCNAYSNMFKILSL